MNYFLSIETTGLPQDKTSSIIKLTMIDEDGNIIINELFKPEFSKTINNTQFHGISDERVKNNQTFNDFFTTEFMPYLQENSNIFVYMRDFVLKMFYKHINANTELDKANTIKLLNKNLKNLSKISQELYGMQALKEKTKVKLENSYPFYFQVEDLLNKYNYTDITLKKCLHLLFNYEYHINHKNLQNIEDIIKDIKNINAEILLDTTPKNTECRIELNYDKNKKYVSKIYLNNNSYYIYKEQDKYVVKDFTTNTTGTVDFVDDKIKITINNNNYWLSDFKREPKTIVLKDSKNKKTEILNLKLFDTDQLSIVGKGEILFTDINNNYIKIPVKVAQDNIIELNKLNVYLNNRNKKFEYFKILSENNPIGHLIYNKETKQLSIKISNLTKDLKVELNDYTSKVITEQVPEEKINKKVKILYI